MGGDRRRAELDQRRCRQGREQDVDTHGRHAEPEQQRQCCREQQQHCQHAAAELQHLQGQRKGEPGEVQDADDQRCRSGQDHDIGDDRGGRDEAPRRLAQTLDDAMQRPGQMADDQCQRCAQARLLRRACLEEQEVDEHADRDQVAPGCRRQGEQRHWFQRQPEACAATPCVEIDREKERCVEEQSPAAGRPAPRRDRAARETRP